MVNEIINNLMGFGMVIGFLLGFTSAIIFAYIYLDENHNKYKNYLKQKYGNKALDNYNNSRMNFNNLRKFWR